MSAITAKSTLYLVLFVGFLAPAPTHSQEIEKPRNLIIFISDGAGPASFTLAREFKRYALNESGLFLDPYLIGTVGTSPAFRRYPDSAAAATAFASGIKTQAYFVAVDTAGTPVGTIIEAAESSGLWTGIISTSAISDATPAAFSSHSIDRYDYTNIAKQQLLQGIELLFGGGRQFFEPVSLGGQREDRVNQIEVARRLGYQFISSRTDLLSDLSLPLIGLFAPDHMSYEIDKADTNEPSLVEMTTIAIGMLSRSDTGFILVVETEGPDDAGHLNETAANLREILAYDEAVKVALDFAREDGETLVIALSDHDTGGLSLGDQAGNWNPGSLFRINSSVSALASILRDRIVVGEDAAQILRFTRDAIRRRFDIHNLSDEQISLLESTINSATRANYVPGMLAPIVQMLKDEISQRASISWASTRHTIVDVNLYAFGPQSQTFMGHLDNAVVGRKIAEAMGLDLDVETRRLRAQIRDLSE
ncbi:MAG: alkaline phosphatase [Rhodothermia bacterium]|nr:MAG: alkaline phosphatase [Rhodothermia bacterium]